jgi:ureidoacrylate peracid hydrolase
MKRVSMISGQTPQEETKEESRMALERTVSLNGRPEPLTIDLARTALVVVDMQNAFASKGGMLDLVGQDISGAEAVIESIKRISEAARTAGVKVIYLKMCYAADLSDSGGPGSPNWHKEFALAAMQANPAFKDKFLIRGSWDAEIVDALRPEPGDVIVEKSRYSGFRGTNLDVVLKTFNTKYLLFTGIATNVCVESTLRDGYFLDYWPILVADGTNNAGPPITQQATLWNVESLFGWVSTTDDVLTAMSSR